MDLARVMDPPTVNPPALRGALLQWWGVHGRHTIPWKLSPGGGAPLGGEILNPYAIWVAEVMLQQTQLQVVLPYWWRWMGAFPDAASLAAADLQDVLLLWQGLGYYSRARRLQQGARRLLESAGPKPDATSTAGPTAMAGDAADTTAVPNAGGPGAQDPWPRSIAGWLALPGIGRSTAGSILSTAFDLPAAILDGNAVRVLARLIAHPGPPKRQRARFWQLSEALLDRQRPRQFNQALMDLGATLCTPRSPACPRCPWQTWCAAYAAGNAARYPVKDAARPVPHQVIGVGVVLDGEGRVLIDQRLNEGLLGGLWEFPGGKQEAGEPIAATIVRELREELAIEVEVGDELLTLDHAYSHRRLRFVVHLCRWQSGDPRPLASQQVRWVAPTDLHAYPFPTANARIIAALLEHLGGACAGSAGDRAANRPVGAGNTPGHPGVSRPAA